MVNEKTQKYKSIKKQNLVKIKKTPKKILTKKLKHDLQNAFCCKYSINKIYGRHRIRPMEKTNPGSTKSDHK